jgi:hypothetical protein
MTAQEIRINRDVDHDILYVLKASTDPKTTTNVIVNANITLRLNKAKEIVGFIIDEFSVTCAEWKEHDDYHLMEEFDQILKVLNDKCARMLTSQATPAAETSAA